MIIYARHRNDFRISPADVSISNRTYISTSKICILSQLRNSDLQTLTHITARKTTRFRRLVYYSSLHWDSPISFVFLLDWISRPLTPCFDDDWSSIKRRKSMENWIFFLIRQGIVIEIYCFRKFFLSNKCIIWAVTFSFFLLYLIKRIYVTNNKSVRVNVYEFELIFILEEIKQFVK